MTLLEKAKEQFGAEADKIFEPEACFCNYCPSDYELTDAESDKEMCAGMDCYSCWAREYNKGPSQRQFDTGAVRDSAVGKGRFDLLPWGAIHELAKHCERGALHYGERNVDKGIPQHSLIDSGVRHLALYVQGDAEAHHLVAALWNIAWAVEQELKRPELVDLPERTCASGEAL